MQRARRYINHNQAFSDFAYRFFLTATNEQKKGLNEFELKTLKDHTSILKFCQMEPHDKIKLYLTKMGLGWIEIWGHNREKIEFAMSATKDQYAYDQKRADLTEAMAADQIFATSDREFTLAYMLAENAHSEVYKISATTKEVVYYSRKYNKRLQISYDDQIAEAKGAYHDLNKLLLAQLNAVDWAKEALNLDPYDIRILSALYDKKHSVLTLDDIHVETGTESKKVYVAKVLTDLTEKKLVLCDVTGAIKKHGKKTFYMITGAGISLLIQYHNHIHRKAFGK